MKTFFAVPEEENILNNDEAETASTSGSVQTPVSNNKSESTLNNKFSRGSQLELMRKKKTEKTQFQVYKIFIELFDLRLVTSDLQIITLFLYFEFVF